MAVSKNQKTAVYAGGALVLLYLVYRWYQNSAAAGAAQGSTTQSSIDPTAASNYASLAGQEQSDVASLQQQNSQLLAQEQSDVQTLSGQYSGLVSTEQGDIANVTGNENSLAATVSSLTTTLDSLASEVGGIFSTAGNHAGVAAVGTGSAKVSRTPVSSVAGVVKTAYNAIFNEGFQSGYNAKHGTKAPVRHAGSPQSYNMTSGVWNQIYQLGYKAGVKG